MYFTYDRYVMVESKKAQKVMNLSKNTKVPFLINLTVLSKLEMGQKLSMKNWVRPHFSPYNVAQSANFTVYFVFHLGDSVQIITGDISEKDFCVPFSNRTHHLNVSWWVLFSTWRCGQTTHTRAHLIQCNSWEGKKTAPYNQVSRKH